MDINKYNYENNKMEKTKNKIPYKAVIFFNNLSNYLDTKLLFFGSVQRHDYFPGHSDIDVAIFTENTQETVSKIQHYLDIPKTKIKKFVWELQNGKFTYGYKTMYKDPNGDFSAELSIYNQKFKEEILGEHSYKTDLPIHASFLLFILKLFYYNFNIINDDYFKYFKKKILGNLLGMPDDKFIVLEQDPDETDKKIYDIFK